MSDSSSNHEAVDDLEGKGREKEGRTVAQVGIGAVVDVVSAAAAIRQPTKTQPHTPSSWSVLLSAS